MGFPYSLLTPPHTFFQNLPPVPIGEPTESLMPPDCPLEDIYQALSYLFVRQLRPQI